MKEEKEFIPYDTSSLPSGPYLVFAPHPDDETFGMGGTIALASRQNIETTVVVLTDGSQAGSVQERQKEARCAAEILGVNDIHFLGINDRELHSSGQNLEGLQKIVSISKPETVFIPSLLEYHPDHRAAAVIIWELLDRMEAKAKFWLYEIHRQGEANRLIDITSVMEVKEKAIRCYRSQLKQRAYDEFIISLNRSRALTLPSKCRYAEAFWSLKDKESIFSLKDRAHDYFKDARSHETAPLVSIIVRTKDRQALLGEALESIAAQNYKNIEVIVVNDGGSDVSDIIIGYENKLPGIRCIDHENCKGRAAAANTGIRNSQGQWIAFLDDDDLLLPNSIETRLYSAIQSGKRVIYGAIECRQYIHGPEKGADDPINIFNMNHEFDKDILLFENYIPLNALLFSRQVFDRYGLMDDDLEVYEDWEFLIRVSRNEDFLSLSQAVGVYRVFSKATLLKNRFSDQVQRKCEQRIFTKYADDIKDHSLILKFVRFKIQHQTRLNTDQKLSLQRLNARAHQLQSDIEQKDRQIKYLTLERHRLLTSKSWQLTVIPRGIVSFVKRIFFLTKKAIVTGRRKRKEKSDLKLLFQKRIKSLNHSVNHEHDCAEHEINPLITIITTVLKNSPAFLGQMLNSVLDQCYPNWELCIAVPPSLVSQFQKKLLPYNQGRERIRLIPLKDKKRKDAVCNTVLSHARGEYVTFLEPEDTLASYALCEVVRLINAQPECEMIYSDEDRIGPDGEYCDTFFKPGWSPEILLSTMYTHRLSVYKKTKISEMGGFRPGFDGSHEYDLALRLAKTNPKIAHIPVILYHSRNGRSKGLAFLANKRKSVRSSSKTIREAIERGGEKGILEPVKKYPGHFITHYPLRGNPLISIIIPTKDQGKALDKCLLSIQKKSEHENYEVIVLDNGSVEEETLWVFQKWQGIMDSALRVETYRAEFNFSALNNYGVSLAHGDLILLLNDDTEVLTPGWLREMGGYAQEEHIGAVGAVLLYPDKTIQHAGVVLNPRFIASHLHKGLPAENPGYFARLKIISNYSAVTGACLMVRKEKYIEVGGFDEIMAVAFNDIDFCLKLISKGYKNVVLPHVKLTHHESLSRGPDDTSEKQRRLRSETKIMWRRWSEMLKADPHYNPNLIRIDEYFNMPRWSEE